MNDSEALAVIYFRKLNKKIRQMHLKFYSITFDFLHFRNAFSEMSTRSWKGFAFTGLTNTSSVTELADKIRLSEVYGQMFG